MIDRIALEAELELLNEDYKIKNDQMLAKLDRILSLYFTECVNGKVIRRFFRHGCWEKSVEIYFEIGFWNDEENRIDFGSDISFEYNLAKEELSVNHGCCGSFTKKDVFQFKRGKLIGYVYDNIDIIENELKKISLMACDAFYDNDVRVNKIENMIAQDEIEQKNARKKEIEDSINVGDTFVYDTNTKCYNAVKLFYTKVTVEKITPKYFVITDSYNSKRLQKVDVVNHIFNGYIKVNEEV